MIKRIKPGFFVVLLLVLTVTGMVGASASGPQAPDRARGLGLHLPGPADRRRLAGQRRL